MASLPNFNALLMDGYNSAREAKRQDGLDNALAAYASNPEDPSAVSGIARYDPRTAIQIGQMQHRQRVDTQTQQAAQQKIIDGKLADGKKAVGQVALQIANLPPQQQAQAWDHGIDYLVGQGYDGLSQFKGKYSPESLRGVLAETGLASEYQSATKPSYMAIPQGGTLVNTRDPEAVAQFAQQGAPPPAPAQPGQPDAARMLQTMKERGFATAEDLAAVKAQLGPNGSQALEGWLTNNRIPVGKQVGGQTYYQVGGKWYDNPEGR